MTNKIIKEALNHGFDDAFLLPIIEFNNNAFSPNKLLEDAKSVLLLLKKHNPYTGFPQASMSVHSHYPAYHKAYIMHKSLIEKLKSMKIIAISANNLPQKSYAISAGLIRLKNSLIYHPYFGSYFVMQTIVTNQKPLSYEVDDTNYCDNCNECVLSCPTNAIEENGLINQRKCIRSHVPVKESIPHYLRIVANKSYIGCDICQSVCPLNKKIKKIQPSNDLIEILDINSMLDIQKNKIQMEKLSDIIGKNEVRPSRAIATACLAAANSKDKKYLNNLEIILSTYISSLPRGYAASAIGKIGSKEKYLEEILKHENDTFVKIEIVSALTNK